MGNFASSVGDASSPEEALNNIATSVEKQQEFRLAVMDKMKDWDAIYLLDMRNARDRDVKLIQAGYRNYRANWLTIFAILLVVAE